MHRGGPELAWESLRSKKKSRDGRRNYLEREYREAKMEDRTLLEKKEGPKGRS